MDENDLVNRLLLFFYGLDESIQRKNPITFLHENTDFAETDLNNVVHFVLHEGYLEHEGIPQLYRITANGMSFLEENDAFPKEELRSHRLTRYRALSILADLGGTWASMNLSDIASQLDLTDKALFPDMDAMFHLNLVKPISHHRYGITESGLRWHKSMKLKYETLKKLREISASPPQLRGREFQSLMFREFELLLWAPEESVKTAYEEIDLIIHRRLKFYLVECKWENKPVGVEPINHLLGKIRKRSGADGIFMSMSGFTRGAVQSVEDSLSEKLMLLFGKHDIDELFEEFTGFENLIEEKTREMISRRKAIWK